MYSVCIPQQLLELCRRSSREIFESFLPRNQITSADTLTSLLPRKTSSDFFFRCQFCKYQARRKDQLKRHIQYIHTGEKPFGCSFCSYRCVSQHTLKIHLRKHTGEKPFQCSICSLKFADPSNFSKHKLIHRFGDA